MNPQKMIRWAKFCRSGTFTGCCNGSSSFPAKALRKYNFCRKVEEVGESIVNESREEYSAHTIKKKSSMREFIPT